MHYRKLLAVLTDGAIESLQGSENIVIFSADYLKRS